MKFFSRLLLVLIVVSLATFGYAGFQGFSTTTDLKLFSKLVCGAGLTCTRTGDKLNMVSSPTTTEVGGFTIKAADGNNAILTMAADNSDDNGDDWAIKSLASGNSLVFQNDTSGSQATKMTLSTAGLLTLTGAITFSNGEVMGNATDDQVRVTSDDSSMIFDVFSPNTSNGDASLTLTADNGADNGDVWKMMHTGSTNALSFMNNTSGSQVAKMTLATDGTATFTGALTLSDAETISNPADDTVRVASNDSSVILDVYSPNTSNGDASVTLTADAGADNGDVWKIMHTGSTNALSFLNNTSGSQVAKMTLSTAGAMTAVTSITGTGAGALGGYLHPQVASTTTGITAAQCGSTFVSNSADVMTLPEASTVLGCRLTFVCGTADDFDIDPADGTDSFGPINSVAGGTGAAITPSAGDAIRCTDIGSSITIEAVGANLWVPIGVANGAWTDVN